MRHADGSHHPRVKQKVALTDLHTSERGPGFGDLQGELRKKRKRKSHKRLEQLPTEKNATPGKSSLVERILSH
jgi:hypothetical protein